MAILLLKQGGKKLAMQGAKLASYLYHVALWRLFENTILRYTPEMNRQLADRTCLDSSIYSIPQRHATALQASQITFQLSKSPSFKYNG